MLMLFNPPNPPGTVSNKDMMGGFGQIYDGKSPIRMPILDLLTAAAVAEDRGITVEVLDCLAEELTLEGALHVLEVKRPDIIAIRTSTPTFNWDIHVTERIKKAFPSLTTMLFGPHATLFARQIITNPAVDMVATGEIEYAIADAASNDKDKTAGLWFKQGKQIMNNGKRDQIEQLDDLPFPAWHLVPYGNYFIGESARFIKPALTIQTSRGCPFNCGYCPYPLAQGTKWRYRSAQKVVDEIVYLVNRFQTKFILFRDAEFTLDKNRVIAICDGLRKNNITIPWRCETRIDTLSPDLIMKMAEAGCVGINMGIESIDQDVLAQSGRKPYRLSDIKQIIDTCRAVGIDTYCFFIIGLPGDTKKKALMTTEFAIKLNPHILQFTVATPYYGTRIRDWAIEKGYISDMTIENLTSWHSVMRNESMNQRQITAMAAYANLAWHMTRDKVRARMSNNGLLQALREAIKFMLLLQKKIIARSL